MYCNYDAYGEVINGQETYDAVASALNSGLSILLGWTDNQSTHYDILFTLNAVSCGTNIQGGIRPTRDLFVSIMRKGSFAFNIANTDTDASYYAEKLYIDSTETSKALAELINGIKQSLVKLRIL